MSSRKLQNILTACLALALVGTLFQNCAKDMPDSSPTNSSSTGTPPPATTTTPAPTDSGKPVSALGSAAQTADLTTVGGTWTDIPGLTLTFTLNVQKTVRMSAMGSVTWVVGSQATGHCGFRFVVNGTPYGNASWGDQIIQVYNWTGWSVERYLPLVAGTHTIKVQQVGWSGTNAGCASNTQTYSAARMFLMAF